MIPADFALHDPECATRSALSHLRSGLLTIFSSKIAKIEIQPDAFALSHQRSTSASPPISANPDAMDCSSAPVAILSESKRASNRARTAGTNDEPPVRKTLSISRAARSASAKASSTDASMAASSRLIQPVKVER